MTTKKPKKESTKTKTSVKKEDKNKSSTPMPEDSLLTELFQENFQVIKKNQKKKK